MNNLSQEPPAISIELEVIACSLDDALAAYRGGASRLEITVRLDHAGLTPPVEMVRQIVQSVPLPVRVMLRDRADFSVGGNAELESLKRKAREFAALNVEGLVVGHVKGGRLDLTTLEEIIESAPKMRVTVHHAIETTGDPLTALRALRNFPNVDRALVSGGAGSLVQRIERLSQYRDAFGPERSLIAGGNLTLDMLKALRDSAGVRIFHLGRAVRTPEESGGGVDSKKVSRAASLLGLK
jgi:copper homeostasis protein